MPDSVLFTQARIRFFRDDETHVMTVEVRDTLTQRDYRYEIPEHLIPSIADGLDSLLDAHPEFFPDTHTRPVY